MKPLGFAIDDQAVRRAGLDYWAHLDLRVWDSLDALRVEAGAAARFFYLTTKTARPYWHARFTPGDYLVFGRETRGLPESLLQAHEDACLTIPMAPAARSLNLATAAAVCLYATARARRTLDA